MHGARRPGRIEAFSFALTYDHRHPAEARPAGRTDSGLLRLRLVAELVRVAMVETEIEAGVAVGLLRAEGIAAIGQRSDYAPAGFPLGTGPIAGPFEMVVHAENEARAGAARVTTLEPFRAAARCSARGRRSSSSRPAGVNETGSQRLIQRLSGVGDLVGLPQLMSGLTRRIASQELYGPGSLRAAGSATSQIVAAAIARPVLTIANGLRSRASGWCRTCLAADTLFPRRQVRGVSGAPFEGVGHTRGVLGDTTATMCWGSLTRAIGASCHPPSGTMRMEVKAPPLTGTALGCSRRAL